MSIHSAAWFPADPMQPDYFNGDRQRDRGYLSRLHLGPVMKQSQPSPDFTPNPSSGTTRNPDKYQRILDAAVAVFADKGFFSSRISDIADRADVADGTVYLYFRSKEKILIKAINP